MNSPNRTWPQPPPNLDDMAFGVPEEGPLSDMFDAMFDMAEASVSAALDQTALLLDPEATGKPYIPKSE